jgi:rRNA maturation endonuclease Nob1
MAEKLVKCKACDKYIYNNSKVCPFCGKKTKNTILPKLLILLGVLVIVVKFIEVIEVKELQTFLPKPVLNFVEIAEANIVVQNLKNFITLTAPIKISAKELYKEYDDNAFAADSKYKNKTLAVTGTMDKVTQPLFSDDYTMSTS